MKLLLFLTVLLIGFKLFAQISINVDVRQKYQTIDNFAASDCWWAHKIGEFWTTANKDSIADLLFLTTKGIGLSAWRLNLGAGLDADIKMIVDSLYAELKSRNVAAEIIIPESGSISDWYNSYYKNGEIYGDFLNGLFNDSDIASKAARIFAGHSYWSDLLGSEVVQARRSLYSRMSPYLANGYKYWMTEYCILEGKSGQGGHGRDLTITTVLDVARIIHFDLSTANASAWQWWLAVSKYDYKDGLIYTDYSVTGFRQNIIQSKTLWTLGNYSRYIRPGSVRISCIGANDKYGLMASAYVDSANSKFIVVFVNVGSATKDVSFNFSGLDSSQIVNYLTPYVTSNNSGDDLKLYNTFSADSVYSVPAKSVVTIVGLLDGTAIKDIKNTEAIPRDLLL